MQIQTLLLVLLFITSCNGQNKSQPKVILKDSAIIVVGHPKIMKPQIAEVYESISLMLQDKAGNLWFASPWGIYRYDGKLFTQFTTKDGLCSTNVNCILEDKTGYLWFGTSDGLCRYDGKNFVDVPIIGNFLHASGYDDYFNNKSSKPTTVWSMLQDKSGIIWFGTGDGVYCYDGKIFTRFLDDYNIINNERLHLKLVDCIIEDKNGVVWFASGMPPGMEGVCRYDGRSLTRFKPNGDGWIRSILEHKTGGLLFATRHQGICLFDGKTCSNITEKAGINNHIISAMTVDKSGNLWIGESRGNIEEKYYGGLWRYDGKTFAKFTMKDGLSHDAICSIKEDKAGNIWIGTEYADLFRYDGKTFTNFTE